jgi:Flp pilus assembly protein TadG
VSKATLHTLKKWWKEDRAVIAVEIGILMPTMLTLLLGIIDIGTGVYINQKLIDADQMIADLLTRNPVVSAAVDIPNAVTAGQLTISPYDTTTFGVDIVGIQFQGGPLQPTVEWRYTTANMAPNPLVPANADNLGNDQDGVLVVTAVYTYVPFFLGGLSSAFYNMQETSFARGRNGLYIPEV